MHSLQCAHCKSGLYFTTVGEVKFCGQCGWGSKFIVDKLTGECTTRITTEGEDQAATWDEGDS